MDKTLDCRGFACPVPVLKTKELLEKESPQRLVVIVDNLAAKENVSRFLTRAGYLVSFSEEDGIFKVLGQIKDKKAFSVESAKEAKVSKKTLVIIATDRLGKEIESFQSSGENLGELLMKNFIATLKEMENLWRIVFLNSGVKFTVDGSSTVDVLKDLQEKGVSILVCGTCLNYYGLIDKKVIGETTNMLDIVTSMEVADKTVFVS